MSNTTIEEKIQEFREKFQWHQNKSWVFVNTQGKEKVEAWIKKALEEQRKEAVDKLVEKLSDDIAEFGDDPKSALAVISETIDMWFMTPEQQKIHNEGHDY